jgi:hypothetical protein
MTEQFLALRPITQPKEVINQLQNGQLLKVSGIRGNGIIIVHPHHAELAGPGAAVGGFFDIKCSRVIPLGKISIIHPQSFSERQKAYKLRQQWIGFTQNAMASSVPLERAHKLLTSLYKYFEPQIIDQLPPDVLAKLVGVLPKTIAMVRQSREHQQLRSQMPTLHLAETSQQKLKVRSH